MLTYLKFYVLSVILVCHFLHYRSLIVIKLHL
nr:MAG TPA: hypothetical protein [Caudoviricetes sp.]